MVDEPVEASQQFLATPGHLGSLSMRELNCLAVPFDLLKEVYANGHLAVDLVAHRGLARSIAPASELAGG